MYYISSPYLFSQAHVLSLSLRVQAALLFCENYPDPII